MKKRGKIAFIMFIFVLILSGCTGTNKTPDIEETIENGGAYKENVSAVNKEDGTSDEEVSSDEEVNPDKEIESDSTVEVSGKLDNSEDLKILSIHELKAETLTLQEDLDRIIDKVHSEGGYISSNNTSHENAPGGEKMKSELTLRIPKDNANNVVDFIDETVVITSELLTSVDVSDEYYDIQTRINNLEGRENRLKELYETSDNIDDIIKIDDKLFEISEEKEQIIQKKIRMNDRVMFSRIDLSLQEVKKFSVVKDQKLSSLEKISDSFKSTGTVVKNTLVTIFIFFIKASPVIILIGLGYYLYRVISRKYEVIKSSRQNEEVKDDEKLKK